MVRKPNGLPAEREKIWVVWMGDPRGPRIPFSQSLIQSKALALFTSTKAEGGEEAAEEESAAGRGGVVRFKETEGPGEAARADGEAAESGPEDLALVTTEGGYCTQQIFNVDKTSFYQRCHLGHI